MEKYQEGASSSSKTSEGNTDRLVPRCVHRKRKRRSEQGREEVKTLKETGKEELETLRHIVPSLRLDDGEVDTVDVIEKTINYIQELHEKIAQRMAEHQEKVT